MILKHRVRKSLLGAIHKGRPQNFWNFGPPPPLVRKFIQPPLLTSSTMSAFGVPPSPPPSADVLYVWPLEQVGAGQSENEFVYSNFDFAIHHLQNWREQRICDAHPSKP